MKPFSSPYFANIDEALSVASKLSDDDFDARRDRQIVANFYNGRALMTEAEAEKENVGSIVNHLFGYSAIDRLRNQIATIISASDEPWRIKISPPGMDIATKDLASSRITTAFCRRVQRSRRLRPQWRAVAGNLVLHGRSVLAFADRTDWCPRNAFLFVPQDSEACRESLPYAFSPEDITFDKLVSYEKAAARRPDLWNVAAIKEALDSIRPGFVQNPIIETPATDDVPVAEHENIQPNSVDDGTLSTRSTLPVWFLYEVDHTDPKRPVGMKIIAKYWVHHRSGSNGEDTKIEKKVLLYENEKHFDSINHWVVPLFIDSEIGGDARWCSAVGIGKLNYDRDADVEEFFNLAMDGAKDQMRTKWKVGEGASREKIQRFFADRQDLVPEGLDPVKIDVAGNYQHAFQVIQILRQLSAEDASSPVSNTGTGSDELEIQAQARQSAAAAMIAARMNDIYDCLDDLGTEMLRRFMTAPLIKGCAGYADIKMFRDEMAGFGVSSDMLKQWASEENGEMRWISVRTTRAIGDGSRANEVMGATELMKAIGTFSPEAQERIKHRFVLVHTKDAELANELVPVNKAPNPDQVARARNENQAALSRGIIGFIPQMSPDDVPLIHALEHDSELEALLARGKAAGGIDGTQKAGFDSLSQHQMMHVNLMKGNGAQAEQANAFEQKVETMRGAAEGLFKAWQEKMANQQIDPIDQVKLQQKDREIQLRERQQASVEQDREVRNSLEGRKVALAETVGVNKVAADQAKVTMPTVTANGSE